MAKITIVGAGSHFTLGLIGDFYRLDDLWGNELVLYDINKERLEVMEKLVKRHIERTSVNLKVKATTDKVEALEGSDFVIVTIRSGGINALKLFLEIPLREGIIQVVGDTVGPSSALKGLFEIPAVLDIARTLEDVSPDALIINFTNPMTAICTAILKGTKVKVVGLCHGIHDIRRLASKLLDLEIKKITPSAGGINHLTWVTSLKYGEEDILQRLKEAVIKGERWNIIKAHPYMAGRELLMTYKHPPTLSDRHTAEFFHYMYSWFRDQEVGNRLREVSWYIDYEKKTLSQKVIDNEKERWIKMKRAAAGEEEAKVKPAHEEAADIISSIINNKRRSLLAVNIPNESYIEGVPKGGVVEVPATVNRDGIKGLKIEGLSESIIAILNLHLKRFDLMAQGILEEDRNLILESMIIDPLTPTPLKAEKILNKFLAEARDLLTIHLK